MADYAISNVPRRVVYAPSGVGPYAFTFEILDQTDIAVYKGSTLLTLTTDYTVTINLNGTGSVTLVATAGSDNITIVGAKNIQRTSDFTTGGDLFADTLNDELDNQTIFIQQVAETAERGLKAPVTDPTDINMTLPSRTSRANKYLAFDANGNPQPGDTVVEVETIAAIADEIVAVAGIVDEIVDVANNETNINAVNANATNINTVASNNANVTAVGGSIANVNTVASDLNEAVSDINTVAVNITNVNNVGNNITAVNAVYANEDNINAVDANEANINTVASNIASVNSVGSAIANVNTVATDISAITTVASDLNEPVSEIETVATNITNVNSVGISITSVNTVAGISANVTTVAGISANVTTVAGISANVTTVAGNTSAIGTVATNLNGTNTIGTVAGINSDVTTVAGIASDVTAVAGIDQTDLADVAAIDTDVTTVAGISGNVTTVAGISANVTSVAGNSTNINTVATDIANVNTVATNIANVNTTATNIANVNTVAGISANVTTVAGISANVTTVATNNANVTTVAGSIANVNTVGNNIANVNQVAADTVVINSASANATAAAASATAADVSATSASASAAAASAVALGNEPVRHSVRPSLLLDFANTKQLDPRITFTRASTASFYDGKTVAKAEENLLLQSQTIATTPWAASAGGTGTLVTPTNNEGTAPDNTTTATRVQLNLNGGTATADFAWWRQNFTGVSGLSYTFSFFAKSYDGTSSYDAQILGIDNIAAAITITGTWTRFTVTANGTGSSVSPGVRIRGGQTPTNSNSVDILIWGAQLEQRSSVTAYTATTTAPITNYIPALQTAASGVARFEHNPITGESLGLLIEEQRTNVCLQSENFGLTWIPTRASVTTNIAVAPDGTLTADKLIANTDNNTHFVNQTLTVTANTNYSYSLYAKAGEYNNIRIRYGKSGSPFTRIGIIVNLTTGAITNSDAATPTSVALRSATLVGNGWYRIVVAGIFDTTSTDGFLEITSVDNSGSTSFAGDGYSGIYIWGAQLEAGAFATSYIPTVASQVTRSADAASMTGTNFSSWYRADEGTIYSESSVGQIGVGSVTLAFSDGTANNRLQIQRTSGNNFQNLVSVGGTTQSSVSVSGVAANVSAKSADVYKVNDFQTAVNNALGTADTSGTIPVVSQLEIGSRASSLFLNGSIKKLAFYPLRLTNAQLQGITTV